MLVHGRAHTGFGLLAFGDGGTALYFSARHADDRDDVHSLPLADPRFAEVRWRSEPGERVSDLFVTDGGQIALTAGRDCESRRALRVGPLPRRAVATLVEEQPSRALGWLDGEHVLVGVGGCRRPLDLYTVDTSSLASRLLVRGVSAASVRRAEPLPPPSLPIKLGPRGKQAAVA
jgi:hypothetical protein